jgi:hypothetical protein
LRTQITKILTQQDFDIGWIQLAVTVTGQTLAAGAAAVNTTAMTAMQLQTRAAMSLEVVLPGPMLAERAGEVLCATGWHPSDL